MRLAPVALALALLAGCSSSPSKDLRRGTGTSGALAPGQTVAVPDSSAAGDLAGAAVTVHAKAQGGPQGQVVIGAADADIIPTGYTALTLPVKFEAGPGTWSRFASFVVPGKAARMPAGSVPGQVEIFWQRPGAAAPVPALVPNIRVDDKDRYKSRFTFDCDELGTFQAAIRANAGAKVTRHFTFRALGGVSMGGQGTGAIAFRHPEKYDMVGLVGPDPGVDLGYTLGYVHGNFMSGFCTTADQAAGRGAVGELCPLTRAPLADQGELQESFEALTYQSGQGVGLTLRRGLYMRAIRDLSRALGNPATYNPASSYLPPGVPEEYLTRADPCHNPVVLKGFYDGRYNPDGSHDVITFCDGYDTADGGYGVFIPGSQDQQTIPTQVLLAVDLNGNGKRDSGEPVIVQPSEPYDDVGCDGCPDQLEDGQGGCVTDPAQSAYDAAANPDPNRDNYHYLHHATGAEANWRWDDCGTTQEPWQDAGLDGVAGAGCVAGSAAECFDFGEGNGAFDYNPMYLRWIAHDGPSNFAKFDAATRARLDIYADAGIRDFFNGHVSVNQFFGLMRSMGENARIWDTFQAMQDRGPSDTSYSAINTDFTRIGSRHVYIRYGNPDALDEQIEAGDGRHVGDALTLVWRVQTMFRWMSSRWPGGDYEDADVSASGDNFQKGLTFTTSWGRETPFALFLPPGYFQNPTIRYPVVYFMHGYGQKPDDLVDSSVLFANYMVGKNYTKEQRYQKFIAVYVDGKCAPQWRLGSDDPVPTSSAEDGCEEGTFYVDTPADRDNAAKMEQMLIELEQYIDTNYRTKAAADLDVVQ